MQSGQHTERRSFSMHPRLLYDVIRRQAGSLGKAVLEAVMNAADARATRVEVTIEPDRVLIMDDGQGFQSEEIGAGRFGLTSMRERAANIGARLRIGSAIGHGTEISVEWPDPDGQT